MDHLVPTRLKYLSTSIFGRIRRGCQQPESNVDFFSKDQNSTITFETDSSRTNSRGSADRATRSWPADGAGKQHDALLRNGDMPGIGTVTTPLTSPP
jgi:hypothetical protein